MKIQSNSSGTRSIEIADEHLQTIEKYQLFRDLIDSNGYVDEQVLDKLMLYINWKNRGNDNLGMTTRAFQGTPFN